jgi:hypothetical protein
MTLNSWSSRLPSPLSTVSSMPTRPPSPSCRSYSLSCAPSLTFQAASAVLLPITMWKWAWLLNILLLNMANTQTPGCLQLLPIPLLLPAQATQVVTAQMAPLQGLATHDGRNRGTQTQPSILVGQARYPLAKQLQRRIAALLSLRTLTLPFLLTLPIRF